MSEKNVVQADNWFDSLPRRQYSQFKKLNIDDWFEVYEVKENIYAIYEPGHFQEVISYLTIGKDIALLQDTGLGIGNIKKVVEKLYKGKVIVVNSHSHFDHIGNNYLFDKVYIYNHPVAISRMSNGIKHEALLDNLIPGSFSKKYPDEFKEDEYEIKPCVYELIEEGYEFDLGNRVYKVIHTPGHSPDSIMLVDEKNKILFTGDTFYPASLYAHIDEVDGSVSNFEVYEKTINDLANKYSDYTLLTSHNEPMRDGKELKDVAMAFKEIADNKLIPIVDETGLKKYVFEDFSIICK